MAVDLNGSSPQVPTAFNVPMEGSIRVAFCFAIRALLMDTNTNTEYIPQNKGPFRPVKVATPLGYIFNPVWPAVCEARLHLIIEALTLVPPDKCTAGNAACLSFASCSGERGADGRACPV